jgi:hypothetical protein
MSSVAFSANASSLAGSARSSRWGYAKIAVATVAAAVLANVVVYFVGDAVVGYNPDFLVLSNVSGAVIFTFTAAVVAVLLYGALLRWAANPVKTFNVISAIVFVLTTIPDFTIIPGEEGASNGQTAVLVIMHVVAAAVIVGMLTKLARPQGR